MFLNTTPSLALWPTVDAHSICGGLYLRSAAAVVAAAAAAAAAMAGSALPHIVSVSIRFVFVSGTEVDYGGVYAILRGKMAKKGPKFSRLRRAKEARYARGAT